MNADRKTIAVTRASSPVWAPSRARTPVSQLQPLIRVRLCSSAVPSLPFLLGVLASWRSLAFRRLPLRADGVVRFVIVRVDAEMFLKHRVKEAGHLRWRRVGQGDHPVGIDLHLSLAIKLRELHQGRHVERLAAQ